MISDVLKEVVRDTLKQLSLEVVVVELEHPADFSHGDYSCNVALVCAKTAGENPRALAERIVAELEKRKPAEIERIEVAGPGFINFHLSREFFGKSVKEILEKGDAWGGNSTLAGKKVMVEYTDPNPFKVFHIGHLMTNIIGESIARLSAFSGGEVKRANYQGDVGLHVAKALWGMRTLREEMPGESVSPTKKSAFLGKAYALGASRYEDDESAKGEIVRINKAVYEKSDAELQELYDKGRAWSLAHFEELYATLGTKFDFYFFESQTAVPGMEMVKEYADKGVFEKSEGALVFRGEKYGLHTRVFLTSEGLPPYEAKDLALSKLKYDTYPYDLSVIITAHEQTPYWQVEKKAMGFIYPDLAEKTRHVGHGMLMLPTGKMSSRKGEVITGESLLVSSLALAEERIVLKEMDDGAERKSIAEKVGVGALKYAILKQAIGKNIMYDAEKSFSFDGDSGPYLQYACVRARAVLAKGRKEVGGALLDVGRPKNEDVSIVERLLYRFPEVVLRSLEEYEPHYLVTYLTELAGAFNSYYAGTHVLGEGDKTAYRLALTKAVATTLKNGLYLLGIEAPERM